MIIEFIGLPGAGKSTLITPFVKLLTDKGYDVINFSAHNQKLMGKPSGKLKFGLFLVLNFSKISKLKKVIARGLGKEKVFKSRFLKLLLLIFSIMEYCKKNDKGVLVLDQAIIQMIGSIYVELGIKDYTITEKVFKESLAFLNTKHNYKVVTLDLPLEIAVNRVFSREKQNCEFKEMTQTDLELKLLQYETFIKTISPDVLVSSIENSDKNVVAIYQALF